MSLYDQLFPMIGTPVAAVELWVPGRPQQWSRGTPVAGETGAFIVQKSKDRISQSIIRQAFQNYLKLHPEDQDLFPWKSAVRLRVHCLYKIPKKYQKKNHFLVSEKVTAPDVSNLGKQVEDSLNPRKSINFPGAFIDDRLITQLYVTKNWHPTLEGTLYTFELWDSTEPWSVYYSSLPSL